MRKRRILVKTNIEETEKEELKRNLIDDDLGILGKQSNRTYDRPDDSEESGFQPMTLQKTRSDA